MGILMPFSLPMQSVPITTSILSSNPAQTRCTRYKLCDKICQRLAASQWFSRSTPVSSTNNTDRHDITEILLKVVLNTINLTYTNKIPKFSKLNFFDEMFWVWAASMEGSL
jgi:hypothetical protein